MSRPAIRYSTANPDLPAVCVSASDYDALAQRCQSLEEAVERMDGCNRAIAADALAACSERDTLRAEVEALQAKLRRIESMAECGSVQSWLSLPDEDKAKWFGLHVEQDFERLKFRSDALALRELVAECAEYLNFNELTSIGHGSILHRKMIDAAMEAPR